MRPFAILCLTAALAVPGMAAALSPPALPAAPPADATIELREVSINIHADGRMDQRTRITTRLHSFFAINNLGDPRLAYDAETQELVIHEARTILPDQTALDAPPYALNESTAEEVAACPAFASMAEMVVTFIGLEPEAVTVLDYEIRDRLKWRTHAEGSIMLGDRFPVVESRLKIRVPGRARFQAAVTGTGNAVQAVDPRLERDDTHLEWVARDLPGVNLDDPFLRSSIPRVVFSTAGSWTALLSPLEQALAAPVAATAPGAASAAWKRLRDFLPPPQKPGLVPVPESVRTARVLADSLRILAHGPELAQRPVRAPEQILASRQATPVEAGLLLATLLAGSGDTSARLLLAGPAGLEWRGEMAPAASLFEEVFVAATVDNSPVYFTSGSFALSPMIPHAGSRWIANLGSGVRAGAGSGAELLPSLCASVTVEAVVTLDGAHPAAGMRTAISGSVATTGAASAWFDAMSALDSPAPFDPLLGKAFAKGTKVDKLTLKGCTPAACSFDFEAHVLPVSPPALFDLGPVADRFDALLLPWLHGEAPAPPLSGAIEYSSTLTFRWTGGAFEPGIAAANAVNGRNTYDVTVQHSGNECRITRHLQIGAVRNPSPPRMPSEDILALFFADNDRVAIYGPASPRGGGAPSSGAARWGQLASSAAP